MATEQGGGRVLFGAGLSVLLAGTGCVSAGGERAAERSQESAEVVGGSPAAGPAAGPASGPASGAVEAASGENPTPRAAAELAVGRWLLVKEEAADGEGPFFEQRWRRFELRGDGTFRGQNHVELREGTWSREGSGLRFDGASIVLERVDESTLVLIEDLSELYRRGGPERRLRNTYRRISESELGPMVGAEVLTSAPRAGDYGARYDYSMRKLPTMEISVDTRIQGQASLSLRPDGSAWGCVGRVKSSSRSESKYSSRDGKHHRSEHEERFLLGIRGRWTVAGGLAEVRAEEFWRGACPTAERQAEAMGPLVLECQAIASNEKLPVETLACRVVRGDSRLHDIALNPAETERSGPYTLQSEPMGHIETDHGRPWILVGAAPGLTVESRDGRRDSTPVVTFRASSSAESTMVEARYVEVHE